MSDGLPGAEVAVGSPDPTDAPPGIDPDAVARVARLHLGMGLYTLARAELEALRVLSTLDDAGLEALAEARWRTGDLAAAGRVAVPQAEAGSDRPLILLIAAEAVAAEGRPGEAGRFASAAMEALDVPLDTLFAGLPRHASWPVASSGEAARGGLAAAPAVASSEAAPSAAAEAYAGGRAALAAGDAARAALEMGVALRLDPGFATEVLDVIGTRATEPGLLLVAGDALRILGREQEALTAYDTARGAAALVADSAAAEPHPREPVAADADPGATAPPGADGPGGDDPLDEGDDSAHGDDAPDDPTRGDDAPDDPMTGSDNDPTPGLEDDSTT